MAEAAQSPDASGLGVAVVVNADIGAAHEGLDVGEWSRRERPRILREDRRRGLGSERDTVAEFAETLHRRAAVTAAIGIRHAGEGHGAAGLEAVIGIDGTEPQSDRAELGTGIDRAETAIDLSRLLAAGGVEVGIGIAARYADPEAVLEGQVGADHEAAGLAGEPGGVAVSPRIAEGSKTLTPEPEDLMVEATDRHHRHRGRLPPGQIGGVSRGQRAVIGAPEARRAATAEPIEVALSPTKGESRLRTLTLATVVLGVCAWTAPLPTMPATRAAIDTP